MALVEQMVPQGLLVWTPPTVNDAALGERLRVQNAYIATTVIRKLLSEDGVNWVVYRHNPSQFTHEAIVESGIREVCDILYRGCARLKPVEAGEMDTLVLSLDLSDTDLYDTYMKVARNLTDSGMNFGRIVTLFFFTYILCKRLHLDNRQRLIESVVEWLTEYLNDTVNPWLEKNHNGQWSRIQGRVNVEEAMNRRTAKRRDGTSTTWATAAVLGVGAFLVGLALR